MPKRTIAYLKSRFAALMKPKQEDYYDIMDSYVHKDDLTAINSQEIDARINAFNTSLREITAGDMDTLGDVLKVFQGFPADWNLKQKIDAAGGQQITWSNVTNKPTNIAVSWTEQRLFLLDKIDRPTSIPASTYTGKSIRDLFIANQLIAANAKIVIIDLEVQPVLVKWALDSTTIMVLSTVAATIGITPKITSLT